MFRVRRAITYTSVAITGNGARATNANCQLITNSTTLIVTGITTANSDSGIP